MLTLSGVVMNVFETPAGTGKDGKPYPARRNVQLTVESILRNGEKRLSLETLPLPDDIPPPGAGEEISLPVGCFVSGNAVRFYVRAR